MKLLNYQEAPEKNTDQMYYRLWKQNRNLLTKRLILFDVELLWVDAFDFIWCRITLGWCVWFYLMSNYFELIPSRENDQSQQISRRNNNWK